MLLERRVGALLVVRDDDFVALRFQPLTKTELWDRARMSIGMRGMYRKSHLVLDGTEETGLLLGRLTAGVEDSENLQTSNVNIRPRRHTGRLLTFIVTGGD